MADETRRSHVGDAVHLRGLVEISNHCARQCAYCGLRAGNCRSSVTGWTPDEIFVAAQQAVKFGYGTVVLQAGEDYGITADWMAEVIRQIKAETPLAVTLSLGERPDDELAAWREAGADRYLLRFETSDRNLFEEIHPPLGNRQCDRIAILRRLKAVWLRSRQRHHGWHSRPDLRQRGQRHRAVPRTGSGHDRHRAVHSASGDAAGQRIQDFSRSRTASRCRTPS